MTSEDKLLHEIHRLKRRVSHLNLSTALPDSRLLCKILEDITCALSEAHDETAILKGPRSAEGQRGNT